MDKGTLVITTTTFMARPWWLFPGYDTFQDCISCYVIGHTISFPIGIAMGCLLYWLLGGR
jgi:hypothetical protein